MHRGLTAAVAIGALVFAIGFYGFVVVFVLAGISDVTGSSRLVAFTGFCAVAVAIAAIVRAAHRRQIALGLESEGNVFFDWVWAFAMVLGASLFSLLASFFVTALLLSMAEHRLLPAAVGSMLLDVRRTSGGVNIVGVVWFLLQLIWVAPMAFRIYRDGPGLAVDAFRLAGWIGVYINIPLSFLALVILFLLGPPR